MAYRPHIQDAQQLLTEEEIIGLMPKSFAFVAKLIGVEAALTLIHTYGGTNIFIPNKHAMNINHPITHQIGLNKLHLLAEHFGNINLEIPMGEPVMMAMRNKMIKEGASKKESKTKLARKFGLTVRRIRGIVNEDKPLKLNQEKNLDLFE